MKRFLFNSRVATALLALVALAAVAAGCSKRVTSADSGYTQVEGTPNANSRLIGWRATPVTVFTYRDTAFGDVSERVYVGQQQVDVTTPGSLRLQLLDGTAASGYQMFSRDANGGFRNRLDHVLTSPRKWTESQWELYPLDDPSPSSYSPSTYVGRGLVGGTATTTSPLSNLAQVTGSPAPSIVWAIRKDPPDSLFTMAWSQVPEAAGYWVHVYQYTSSIGADAKLKGGSPSPVFNDKVRDIFLGYVPNAAGPVVSYKLGAPGALVLTRRTTLMGQTYLVRVSAVDANGALIAYMPGDTLRLPSASGTFTDGTYTLSAVGHVAIVPAKP
jgi:hypothetical protein